MPDKPLSPSERDRGARGSALRTPDYELLPEHLRAGMRRYIEHRILPGDFLRAVLRNDFVQAVLRADADSFAALHRITLFLVNEMPADSWGSREKVEAWKVA